MHKKNTGVEQLGSEGDLLGIVQELKILLCW